MKDQVYNYNSSINACITGKPGCLSEDTIIAGQTKTLKELFELGIKYINTLSVSKVKNVRGSYFFVKSNSEIILSGVRDIYEIELEDGRKIKATKKHIFFRLNNKHIPLETKLEDLKPGDKLRVYPREMVIKHKENSIKKDKEFREKHFKKHKQQICTRCHGPFYFEDITQTRRRLCKLCIKKRKGSPTENYKFRGWRLWELEILKKTYFEYEKEEILKLLPLKSKRAIEKKCSEFGLKRHPKFCKRNLVRINKENNPAKRKDIRKMKSILMKSFFKNNPNHNKNIFTRGKKTSIEKIMNNILVIYFNLSPGKDFFYDKYLKVEGTFKFPDFIIPSKKLVIECDGSHWHKDKTKEKERDLLIKNEGYDILHFTNQDLINNKEGVKKCIAKKLNQ